jgi:Uma2 family endonuclease
MLTEPVVIFEVLSEHTARTDRMVKNREYAGTASVRRYVMLEQTAVEGMMFSRTADGEDWVGHILDAYAVLRLPEIGIELPLAVLYDTVDLAEPEEDSA